MNAVLDYDTLEILGAAIRDAGRCETEQPLPDQLRALCEKLGEESAGASDDRHADRAERHSRSS